MSQGLTIHDLRALKGKRRITFVQVAREEEAAAAAEAGMDMIGTAFRPETLSFPAAARGTHFQFGLIWGRHASATEALRDAMAAMQAGAQSIYCAMSAQVIEVLAREGIPVIAHAGLVPPKVGSGAFPRPENLVNISDDFLADIVGEMNGTAGLEAGIGPER